MTPDTLLGWYRKLVAAKYNGAKSRRPGRPPTRVAAPVTLTGTAALVDQVPLTADHTTTSLDLVDLNGDGRRDLAVQRKQGSSGAFLQEQGLFAATPNLAVETDSIQGRGVAGSSGTNRISPCSGGKRQNWPGK